MGFSHGTQRTSHCIVSVHLAVMKCAGCNATSDTLNPVIRNLL